MPTEPPDRRRDLLEMDPLIDSAQGAEVSARVPRLNQACEGREEGEGHRWSGEDAEFELDGPVGMEVEEEGFFAAFWVAGEGGVDEARGCGGVDDFEDADGCGEAEPGKQRDAEPCSQASLDGLGVPAVVAGYSDAASTLDGPCEHCFSELVKGRGG